MSVSMPEGSRRVISPLTVLNSSFSQSSLPIWSPLTRSSIDPLALRTITGVLIFPCRIFSITDKPFSFGNMMSMMAVS